jgi:hypothetical protein
MVAAAIPSKKGTLDLNIEFGRREEYVQYENMSGDQSEDVRERIMMTTGLT